MSKCIAYALFGYNKSRQENCFDFNSYFRHFMINLRMNRLIYPSWVSVLYTDQSTYDGFSNFFEQLRHRGVVINICTDAPLCKAMLWRLKPAFEYDISTGFPIWSHALCRDLDSPSTYREAQAVTYWISKDKAMHAITDSVSHNIPLMGGMIGLIPRYFGQRIGVYNWENLIAMGSDINFSVKGSDQTFLNKYIYPCFAQQGTDSITQHYILGHGNTWLSDYHNKIQDIQIDIPEELRESNDVCGHIGSSGYYSSVMDKFINKYKHLFTDLLDIERAYPNIFLWVNEEQNKLT